MGEHEVSPDALAAFWSHVDKRGEDECWPWRTTETKGYGRIQHRDLRMSAHRASWVIHHGPIPEGMTIDHLCHTYSVGCVGGNECEHRRCVNPRHLEVVTPGENSRRALTSPTSLNAKKTACLRGHRFAAGNYRVLADGSRECLVCRRARDLARYHAGKKKRYAKKTPEEQR